MAQGCYRVKVTLWRGFARVLAVTGRPQRTAAKSDKKKSDVN